ncbi:TonB-dependent receptor [Candidatus Pelagisphaera phototrophica]|uniref:TonB-dependent receptor n=1 Tax=Candidatus Pelagisphaera phototrophica TaxID=2684113 RepID=UPI001A078A72|nr:TonB-dependent receptor [Candidatus Pelagisphaera phototrophica]QXD31733.1 TonB-dependent receptor [Candidatus Pelagisphaera phototrophica]
MKLTLNSNIAKHFYRCFAGLVLASGIFDTGLLAGTISGRVLNDSSGEYLYGAVIRVTGTDYRASTNIQGSYSIKNVPEGEYTVEVSYIGLGRKTQQVSVSDAISQTVDFDLSEDIVELEGVRVEQSLIGQSAAINQQRVASGLVTVISEEEFGQMNDGNIGLALQKMPGLSVDTDGFSEVPRYVNIRGVDTQYVNVQLDGNRMPSSGHGGITRIGGGGAYGNTANGMALDDVPGDAITNVEIWKSPLPEHDGDSLGGIVNLETRSAFQRNGRYGTYRAGFTYSALRDEMDPNFSLGYSDIFGDKQNFGINVAVSYHKVNEGFDNIDYDWIPMFHRLDFGSGQDLVNDYLAPSLTAAEEGANQEVIFFHEDTEYNNYNIERERFGVNLGFDYKVSDETEVFFKVTWHQEDRQEDDIRHHLIMDNDHENREDPYDQFVSPYSQWDSNYDAGNYFTFADTYEGDLDALINDPTQWGAGGFNPGNLVRLGGHPDRISTLLEISDTHAVTGWNTDGTGRGRSAYEGQWNNIDIEFLNLHFGGETEMPWGTWDYDIFTATTDKLRFESDTEFRRSGFQWAYDRSRDPFQAIFINQSPYDRFGVPTQGDPDQFFRGFFQLEDRTVEETYTGIETNVEIPFADSMGADGSWKFGVKFQKEDRESDYDELQFNFEDGFPYAQFLRDNPYDDLIGDPNYRIPYTPDVLQMRANATNGSYFSLRSGGLEDSFEQDYEATRDTLAGYVQGKWQTDKWEFIAGARWETVDFSSSQFVTPEGDYLDGQQVLSTSALDQRGETTIQYIADSDGQTRTIARDSRSRSWDEFLPSMHYKYFFNDNLIGRASLGRTYGRANFSDLLGRTIVDDTDSPVAVSRGNPLLPNLTSNNADLSLEYYTDNGGIFAAGLFYKDIKNFSFEGTETGSAADFGLDPSLGDVEVSTALSGPGAVNMGLELAWYQNLGAFGSMWEDFTLNANATLTDSDAEYPGRPDKLPTRGASNTLYFVGLQYDKGPFEGQLSYRFRSQYIEGLAFVDQQESSSVGEFAFVGDDQFDDSGEWDINLKYSFNERIGVYCNVTNVLNEIRKSVQGYRQYGDDSYWNQRRINFGITGEF